jgi:hypothetical protein
MRTTVRSCTVVAAVLLGLAASPLARHVATAPQEVRDRTTPLVSRMTDEQKEHARFHVSQRPASRRENLLDKGLVSVITSNLITDEIRRPASQVIHDLACGSDAVFIARVKTSTVLPTEDGTLVFTDYEVDPRLIFRTPSPDAVVAGRRVIVTRLGGRLVLDDAIVGLELSSFPPLDLEQEYLFFLKYHRSTTSSGDFFDTREATGVFKLTESRLIALQAYPTSDLPFYGDGIDQETVFQWLRGVSCQ